MTEREKAVNEFLAFLDALASNKQENLETEDLRDEESKCDTMTPLETLISNRITQHIDNSSFPSLEEAKTIYILDMINSKYNQ